MQVVFLGAYPRTDQTLCRERKTGKFTLTRKLSQEATEVQCLWETLGDSIEPATESSYSRSKGYELLATNSHQPVIEK